MLGVGVPDDMDGRLLADMFVDEARPQEVVTVPVADSAADSDDDGTYSDDDATYSSEDDQLISDRLRALGYID